MLLDISKAREALFNCGISYADFAKRFGIHRSYLYNAMNGIATPGRKFFAAWARFCRLYELDFLDFIIFDEA
ncbi:MAG: helix-turn-helix transcriptional regulator [Clostridia bacterium]|nr:helix-turn-helix transcriptional regulator [Clostridia bacterium]